LQQAIKIDPSSRPLKLQLAQTLYDAGRFDEAKRYFNALLPTSPCHLVMASVTAGRAGG
jgi:Tfp pilus assembly protein PilF